MAHLASFHPQLSPAQPAAQREPSQRLAGGGMFWNPGIGLGAGIVLELAGDIDSLSQRIAELPGHAGAANNDQQAQMWALTYTFLLAQLR